MVKISTRVSRYWSTKRGRSRQFRPKTFKSEESANKWAKEQGFKNFTVENMQPNKEQGKYRVIVEI